MLGKNEKKLTMKKKLDFQELKYINLLIQNFI